MAILGKIRQRSIFLILVIGLALFAFVISGAFGNGSGDTGPNEPIGIVNGEEIPLETFRLLVDQTERTYGYTTLQAVQTVWNQFVRNELFQKEFDVLGIDAGKDQIEQVVSSTESIITDARFINEAGFFDFGLFADFIAQMRDTNPQAYETWKQQEAGIIASARESIYFDLIQSSTAVTDQEAKTFYHLEADNVDLNYVQIPYASLADSLFTIKQSEVKAYIKDNASKYEREASRSLQYISFLEQATEEDQTVIRNGLEGLADDRVEYNDVSKLTDTILGFKNTKNLTDFIDRYSEESFDSIYSSKGRLPAEYAEILYNLGEGEVFGPYRDINTLKLSKLLDRKEDANIRASHILIAYQGAERAQPNVTRTKAEAKALANNLLRQVRRDSDRIGALALQNSDGPSRNTAGDLGFFSEGDMDDKFFEFANKSRVGAVGLVETPFGFHVIKVTDKQDLVLLASVSREIVPSDQTSNRIFKDATQFEMDAGKGEFAAVAEASNFNVRTVNQVAQLDENLPGLPEQRNIVQWAFNEDTKVGEIKRFNLSYGGYAVVQVTAAREKGLAAPEEVLSEVTQAILKEKKAAQIIANNKAISSLEDLAAKNGLEVVNALAVNQKSGTLVGAGFEPYIVGVAFSLKEGGTSKLIEGNNGVYLLQLTAKKIAEDLEDYSDYARQLTNQGREGLGAAIVEALETSAEIEDNRALYY
ncbi:MAG: peptidylprolyl isomerase [Flavobacteriaceae bacterium]|nr:peptidylprolyl isomerase [Flavobacteriaceae bacterium]